MVRFVEKPPAANQGKHNSDAFLIKKIGLSPLLLGTIVLAVLTGIPNMITSVKLAKEGNGAAVKSESLNSNNLNIFWASARLYY